MKKYMTEIKWGLIFVVAALVWMMFEKAMGWHGKNISSHAMMTNIFAIVAIAGFYERNDHHSHCICTQSPFTVDRSYHYITGIFSEYYRILC